MKFKTNPNLLMLLFVIGVLFSCKSSIPLANTTTKTVTKTVVVRDTVIQIEKDSSSYKALLKCREGKVVIEKVVDQTASKNLLAPKVEINDDQLEVDCTSKAYELFRQWKENHTEEITIIEKPYPVERALTFWQKLFIWFGKFFLILIVVALLYWIIKFKKYIKL